MSRKRLSFKVPWSEVECISGADEEECLALARAEFRRAARQRAAVEAAQDDAPTPSRRPGAAGRGLEPSGAGSLRVVQAPVVVIVGRGVRVVTVEP